MLLLLNNMHWNRQFWILATCRVKYIQVINTPERGILLNRTYRLSILLCAATAVFFLGPLQLRASVTAGNGVIYNIESPSSTSIVLTRSQINISGWILDPHGVRSVQVLLDGTQLGNAQTGIVRADVQRAYKNQPQSLNSGFKFTTSAIKYGKHTLIIVEISKDGEITTLGKYSITRRFPFPSLKRIVKSIIGVGFLVLTFRVVSRLFRAR